MGKYKLPDTYEQRMVGEPAVGMVMQTAPEIQRYQVFSDMDFGW